MLRTHGNTTVLVSLLSVIIIIALAAGGIGGRGPNTLTAFAETGDGESGKEAAEQTLAAGQELGQAQAEEKKKKEEEEKKEEERQEQQADSRSAREPAVSLTEKEKPSVSLDQEDYQVLLKIVEAEAGICDEKGKILVANVVLNRVRSQEFPDTVREVVYQPSQFSPVSNGAINTCQVTSETIESVDRALAGEDYSQGALYFMNRSASQNGAVRWFDGRLTFLFRHQGHEFFK